MQIRQKYLVHKHNKWSMIGMTQLKIYSTQFWFRMGRFKQPVTHAHSSHKYHNTPYSNIQNISRLYVHVPTTYTQPRHTAKKKLKLVDSENYWAMELIGQCSLVMTHESLHSLNTSQEFLSKWIWSDRTVPGLLWSMFCAVDISEYYMRI